MSLLGNQTLANEASAFYVRVGDAIVVDRISAEPGDALTLAAGTASIVINNNGTVSIPGAAGLVVKENIHARTMDLSGALTMGGALSVAGNINGATITSGAYSGTSVTVSGNVKAATASVVGNLHAGTMDVSGTVLIAGKPVAQSRLVSYVGVSGLSIPVAIGNTVISSAFSVIGGHTYRVSSQVRIISGDTNPGNWVGLYVGTPDVAAEYVEMGHQISGPNNETGGHIYSALYKPTASSSTCILQCTNATIAPALIALNDSNAAFNPGVLVEDLGVL